MKLSYFESGQPDKEEMSFKEISILSSGGQNDFDFARQGGYLRAILMEGIFEEYSLKLF